MRRRKATVELFAAIRREYEQGIGTVAHAGSQTEHMTTSVGYASSSDYGVHFGFGRSRTVDRLELLWPSGVKQTFEDVTVNRVLTVTEPK